MDGRTLRDGAVMIVQWDRWMERIDLNVTEGLDSDENLESKEGWRGSNDSGIMTGIEGLEDHGALESLLSTVSMTKGIIKATLANRNLRKSTLALLESRVGEIQDLFGLPEAVTLCKNAKLLKDVCLGRDAHVTQEVIKHLVTKEVRKF